MPPLIHCNKRKIQNNTTVDMFLQLSLSILEVYKFRVLYLQSSNYSYLLRTFRK